MNYSDWNIHRALEVASRLIDALRDEGYSNAEIIEILNDGYNLDLQENEIHFLGLDENEENL